MKVIGYTPPVSLGRPGHHIIQKLDHLRQGC